MSYVIYNRFNVEYKDTLAEVNEYITSAISSHSNLDPVLLFNFKFTMKDRYKVKDIPSQIMGFEYASGYMDIFLVCQDDV